MGSLFFRTPQLFHYIGIWGVETQLFFMFLKLLLNGNFGGVGHIILLEGLILLLGSGVAMTGCSWSTAMYKCVIHVNVTFE